MEFVDDSVVPSAKDDNQLLDGHRPVAMARLGSRSVVFWMRFHFRFRHFSAGRAAESADDSILSEILRMRTSNLTSEP